MVLVQDGPVPDELAEMIGRLVAESPVHVDHLVIEENLGLGPALDRGLTACEHEIVARMDADDVSLATGSSATGHFYILPFKTVMNSLKLC